jgi:hypothetical protein
VLLGALVALLGATGFRGHSRGSPPIGGVGACAHRGCVSVVLVRVLSLVLVVVGIVLQRWDLAGEKTPVLGIPVNRFE